MPARANKLVLLGDSIIDNGVYVVDDGKSVLEHLQDVVTNFEIDQRALDGAMCSHVFDRQLTSTEDYSSHAVLSVGGNDAFGNIHLLESTDQQTFIESLLVLSEIQEAFRDSYRQLLDALRASFHRCLVMTIYRPRFALDGYPAPFQKAAETALSVYNDVIQEEAGSRNFDLLDLRRVCNENEDFANPIEPSDQGGRKIANEISNWLSAAQS